MKIPELVSAFGVQDTSLSDRDLYAHCIDALKSLGPRGRVLALPPDGTRAHSRASVILKAAYDLYGDALVAVMPALGTHRPMSEAEVLAVFPGIPYSLFRPHDWRNDVIELGRVPASFVREVSDGLCDFYWPAQVNRLVAEGGFDLILSIGQVVPHEVVGMANYSKNLFVGTGGKDGIDRSHWLGAAYGIERVLGRVDTPVRAVLDYAQEHFASTLPILYALTVIGPDDSGADITRGIFIGAGRSAFEQAAELSSRVNIFRTGKPVQTMVVWLDPQEFRSTWLGNKAIYRSRLAMAEGGRLIVLAPGVASFGEDERIDRTIRRYGYRGAARARELVESGELSHDLAGAAHLAHGSAEGRFEVVYATGGLSREDIECVGYRWDDYEELSRRYDRALLSDGWNSADGEEFYFIRNPALGLWMA
ncbi:MAG: DUF2088 domain-containing protein [Spirochaetales bacterium]|nr:MAG: DUF2088 domain-containing protein [Spirochaetales bacterium]